MSPKIHSTFWSDDDVENLDSNGKLTLLWLITNPNVTLVGTVTPSLKRFSFDTGLPCEALQRAIIALPDALAEVDGVIFIRNFIRHQFGCGPKLVKNNIFTSIQSAYESIKDDELRMLILEEYPEFNDAEEGLTKGLQAQRERTGTGTREGKGTEKDTALDLAEEIYELYPRKVYRKKAISAILRALKREDSVTLRQKTLDFAAAVQGKDIQFIPHPSTWFNGEGYNNDPENWKANGTRNNQQSTGGNRPTTAQQRNANISGADRIADEMRRADAADADDLPFLSK